MTALAIAAMPGDEAAAARVAALLGVRSASVAVHRFPDGESLVRVAEAAATTLLYCTLDRPDPKLMPLLLAASALRDDGAQRLVLVAPYLPYMRQDTAFRPGEAVSQRVIGRLLGARFDRIVTVDPHLHRTPRLDLVFAGTEATALSAAPVLAAMIAAGGAGDAVLVGPDAESAQWVGTVAARLGMPAVTATKRRAGDRRVAVTLPDGAPVRGRPAILVDDVVSSGGTLAACARALVAAGAARVEAVAVHALCGDADLAALTAAGIARLRSTDSVAHPTNAGSLAPLLADALRQEVRP
ncbi:MAG: ribose-phosphate diphosphokinase [Alphaproteobacteria bacterium]